MSYNPNELLKLFFNKNFYISTGSILLGIFGGKFIKIVSFTNHDMISYLINALFCFCAAFLILTLGIISFKMLTRNKYCKYCPKCDAAIESSKKDIYCSCGSKYLTECPKCKGKIRDNGLPKYQYYLNNICPNCGAALGINIQEENKMAQELAAIKDRHNWMGN